LIDFFKVHLQNLDKTMNLKDKIASKSDELLRSLKNLDLNELERLVNYHNRCYFIDFKPEISDEAFDKLVEALRLKNPGSELLKKIGSSLDENHGFGEEVVHTEAMLSLDKCYDDDNFKKWSEKIAGEFVAMPKIDGVASCLSYDKDGHLHKAATRGDGRVGEDITRNIRLIKDLPKKLALREPLQLEIRGEVYLPLSRFKKEFAETFANPRNLAAGALKQKTAERSEHYGLCFFPYDIRGLNLASEKEKFEALKNLGFSMMPWRLIADFTEAMATVRDFARIREELDYEIDGVVFRANRVSEQLRLGETAHHPRFAIAYKFQGESAVTELLGIEWSVARSGAVTPVALVKPVFVSGASISRASLHNFGIFKNLALKSKSLVEIKRRGGVIPQLEQVLQAEGDDLEAPTRCPSCDGPLLLEGDFLYCSKKDACEEIVVGALVHFCRVIGLEGFGEKLIRKLFQAGMLNKYSDLFRLKKEDLLSLDRMGEKLADKLIREREAKNNISLAIFIESLGIDEVGRNIAELIASQFISIDKIINLEAEDLEDIHGIGPRISESFMTSIKSLSKEISELERFLTISHDSGAFNNAHPENPLYGKNFVFTGKMAHLERKSAQDLVKKRGGHAPSAMSSQIDYLVIGDEASALLSDAKKSSKHKEAEKMIADGKPIRIISESEFLAMAKD
jgi:DNA ligase (NAD+)